MAWWGVKVLSDQAPRRVVQRDAFSPDYFAARARFLAAAATAGGRCEAVKIAASGPTGEDLFLDAARLGPSSAAHVLLLTSGLHGVEGFFGSAVQCQLLEEWCLVNVPASTAVVLLHALNPFGFAWLRRANEHNIDCNRNFLLAGQQYRGAAPGYAALDPLLNPAGPPLQDAFRLRVVGRALLMGLRRFKQAVAAGQYDYPRGLFFGGHGPSETQRVLREHLPRWLGAAEQVLHLDYHTGLGRWGQFELYLDQTLPAARRQDLEARLAPGRLRAAAGGDLHYVTRGCLQPWLDELLAGRDYVGLCAEFGAFGPLRVLAALRAENQAHHYCDVDNPRALAARERLREAFCPADPRWRSEVVRQGCALAQRALAVTPSVAVVSEGDRHTGTQMP